MSKSLIVKVLVEGQTEEKFIKQVVAPYLSPKSIFMKPVLVSKKGQDGGDVKFERLKNDIRDSLKQKDIALVTCFVDYYGLSDWPLKNTIRPGDSPQQIADTLNQAAKAEIDNLPDALKPSQRFLPFMAVHEFEALLFSSPEILAAYLGISPDDVIQVLKNCGSPERINNSPDTAPSKRIQKWKSNFKKTTDGIQIAQEIGLETIRQHCPLFHNWLTAIEELQPSR